MGGVSFQSDACQDLTKVLGFLFLFSGGGIERGGGRLQQRFFQGSLDSCRLYLQESLKQCGFSLLAFLSNQHLWSLKLGVYVCC